VKALEDVEPYVAEEGRKERGRRLGGRKHYIEICGVVYCDEKQ
jgi:hypothetical protein